MEPVKLKALLSVIIISSGAFLMLIVGTGASASAYQSQGLAVDFGGMDVVWTDADLNVISDPIDLLISVCNENGFICNITGRTVDGITRDGTDFDSDALKQWRFWVILKGDTEWTEIGHPYDVELKGYTTCVWAYCGASERPAVGADQSGNSIYGYARPQRTVSLSPSITEIFGSLRAVSTLVGVDRYSNYPDSVMTGRGTGDIAVVGDFIAPSYELIMGTQPEMVFCDGSQYSHYEMSERLRRSSVGTVVLYSGESIETIMNNIYIVGVVLNYELAALEVVKELRTAQQTLIDKLYAAHVGYVTSMLALSPDVDPWVSGKYTYADDMNTLVFGVNAMPSNFYGWVHATPEAVPSANPSVIIIISSDYHPGEYGTMWGSLSELWKSTDAYKSGQIYLFCDELAEMASRPGPRYMQAMELIAMILHPGAFSQTLPKAIGGDYEQYLDPAISKYLGFNN